MSQSWYALHVRSRFEKVVQKQLENKGYEVILPTYTSARRWSDRVKSLSLPLFPNYVFCRFDIGARLQILITPGVNYAVGAGNAPVAVAETEITALRCLLRSGVAPKPWHYVEEGERVYVTAGPLKGLAGIVVRVKGSARLIVSVSLLMRSVAVEIDRQDLRPLDESAKTPELLRELEVPTQREPAVDRPA